MLNSNFYSNQNEQILSSLSKVKSSWELLYNIPLSFNVIKWELLIENLIPLFRKDSFEKILNKKEYYPQPTPNCRYYIKPNDGSCGKGIIILNSKPQYQIKDHTICPEIITPLVVINEKKYKYDFRVWIGISSNLEYYICPTFIKRISTIPFDISKNEGSLTNTSLYSEQFNYKNNQMYNQMDKIVQDILNSLEPFNQISNSKNQVMLTGWDFILNENNQLFVLEVNCSPGINILHKEVMLEFLGWIDKLEKTINID